DVKGDWQVAILDNRPQRVVKRQVVVRMASVVSAPDRLRGQRDSAEAQFGDPPDFGDRNLDVRRHDRGERRHEIVIRTEGLPRPVVPHAALRGAELDVLRRPHRKALVGEQDFGVDAVAGVILDALERIAPGVTAQPIFATLGGVLNIAGTHARFLVALDHHPLLAVLVDLDMRQTRLKFLVDALPPKAARLVAVAISRDHQIAIRIVGSGRTLPPRVTRSVQTPAVFLVDCGRFLIHLSCSPSARCGRGCSTPLWSRLLHYIADSSGLCNAESGSRALAKGCGKRLRPRPGSSARASPRGWPASRCAKARSSRRSRS